MSNNDSFNSSMTKFYVILLALSIPFWILGAMAEQLSKYLPMNLPASALMIVCPILTAVILIYRTEGKAGIKQLFTRVFDFSGIKQTVWYIPIFLIMPTFMLLSYWIMRIIRMPLPEPHIPWFSTPVLFVIFYISAVCEETGFMGYLAEPMLKRWSALKTGIVLGAVWAVWHAIPFIQTHRGANWIIWQCFFTIAARIIIIWLYNNNAKSIPSAVLFHTMINVSDTLFPNNSSHYNPAVTGIIAAVFVIIITYVWGYGTLAHYGAWKQK